MIFFDMDGTLAKFYQGSNKPLETMYEKGFFFNLKPYKLAEYVNELASKRDDVFILSACIESKYCREEKIAWLNRYCPNISEDNMIFCPCGTHKGNYVYELFGLEKNEKHFLIDDYSRNLYEWEMCGKNFIAVKFINEVNNKRGLNYKYKFKKFETLKKIIDSFEKVED